MGCFHQICIKYTILGRPRATEPYCRDETDLIELTRGSDFVARSQNLVKLRNADRVFLERWPVVSHQLTSLPLILDNGEWPVKTHGAIFLKSYFIFPGAWLHVFTISGPWLSEELLLWPCHGNGISGSPSISITCPVVVKAEIKTKSGPIYLHNII